MQIGAPLKGAPMRLTSQLGSDLRGVLRDDPNLIVDHLQEAALHLEPLTSARAEAQLALAQQRHHGRVTREDADLAVERGGDDGLGGALEEDSLR